MFDKLKQLGQLKKIQEQMKQETVEVSDGMIKVVLNGNFEVKEIVLNPELSLEDQSNALKSCFNQAVKDVQLKIAQNFSELM